MRIDIRAISPTDGNLIMDFKEEFGFNEDEVTGDGFIMLHNNKISGMCLYAPLNNPDYTRIKFIFISEEYRNTGCGRKLLMHTLREIRKNGTKYAVVFGKEGEPFSRFAKKFGFSFHKETENMPDYNIIKL